MKDILRKRNRDTEFINSRQKLLIAASNLSIKETELREILDSLSIAAIDYQDTDSNNSGIFGSTVLHIASGHGNLKVVSQLLERGANVTLTDNRGQTPLHWATRANQVESARLLTDAFPGLVNWQDYGGHTPLHLAARGTVGQPLLDVLLSIPIASLTPLDNRFATPLHVAAACGFSMAVESLIRRGVVPDKWRDDRGASPMHYAALQGHWEVFMRLMTASSSHDHEDSAGLSPMLWACLGRDTDNFVRPYVSRNPSALQQERAPNGASALHLAAQTGNLTQISSLLELDGSRGVEDMLKMTPLHYAAAGGCVDAVQLLLSVCPLTTDSHGRAPLHWAAKEGNVETVAALLARSGCWTRILDADRCSPLHLAAYHGHLEVCKLLLDRVPPQRRAQAANLCQAGLTALDVALHRGGTLVSELLIARGGHTMKERREAAAAVIQKAVRRFLSIRRREVIT